MSSLRRNHSVRTRNDLATTRGGRPSPPQAPPERTHRPVATTITTLSPRHSPERRPSPAAVPERPDRVLSGPRNGRYRRRKRSLRPRNDLCYSHIRRISMWVRVYRSSAMRRRKLLLGMGSLAAGGAATMGTGAFFTSTSDRSANINTVTDSAGLIALRDSTPGPIVRQQQDGEIVVDFSAGGRAGGVNTNSQYQIGTLPPGTPGSVNPIETGRFIPDAHDDPAFKIVNQTTQPKDISVGFADTDIPNGQVVVTLATDEKAETDSGFLPNKNNAGIQIRSAGSPGKQGTPASVEDVEAGQYVGVSILVNTDDDSNSEVAPGTDLSGELVVEATDP